MNFSDLGVESEYQIFKHIRATENPDCWGLLSWKFELKCCVSICEFIEWAESGLSSGVDCCFINPMILNEAVFADVWEQGELVGHKGMKDIRDYLQERGLIKVSPLMDRSTFAMCNYFVGNRRFWDRYFNFVDKIQLALDAASEQGSVAGEIYKANAGYIKNTSLSMKPFIVERLFSEFAKSNTDLVFSHYSYSPDQYEKKLGRNVGAVCKKLSDLKNRILDVGSFEMYEIWNSGRAKFLEDPNIYHMCLHMDDPSIELSRLRWSIAKRLRQINGDGI